MLLRFVFTRGAGGMSVNWNLPKVLLSDAIGRSPAIREYPLLVDCQAQLNKLEILKLGL